MRTVHLFRQRQPLQEGGGKDSQSALLSNVRREGVEMLVVVGRTHQRSAPA